MSLKTTPGTHTEPKTPETPETPAAQREEHPETQTIRAEQAVTVAGGASDRPDALLDLAIAAWLHAKHQLSQSDKTRAAYQSALLTFRTVLRNQGLDLDAADPRQIRMLVLAHRSHRPMNGIGRVVVDDGPDDVPHDVGQDKPQGEQGIGGGVTEGAEEWQWPYRQAGGRLRGADSGEDSEDETGIPVELAVAEAVERLQAERTRLLALAAQAFATTPAQTRYGPRPVTASTSNLRLAALSSFYTYALQQDFLRGPNPLARVTRRKVRAYEGAHPLAYEELRARLSAIDRTATSGQRDYALLLIGLHTGRRLAELAGMRREHLLIRPNAVEITWPRCKGGKRMRDVLPRRGVRGIAADALVAWVEVLYPEHTREHTDLGTQKQERPEQPGAQGDKRDRGERGERGERGDTGVRELGGAKGPKAQTVAVSPPGGAKTQTVAVQERAAERPAERPTERPLWISLAKNGTYGHALNVSSIADICEKRLGTRKVHTLRHTFARALEDAGAKVSDIQAQLGHESLDTTGRYLARLHQGENRHLGQVSSLYGLTHADVTPDSMRDALPDSMPAPQQEDHSAEGDASESAQDAYVKSR